MDTISQDPMLVDRDRAIEVCDLLGLDSDRVRMIIMDVNGFMAELYLEDEEGNRRLDPDNPDTLATESVVGVWKP